MKTKEKSPAANGALASKFAYLDNNGRRQKRQLTFAEVNAAAKPALPSILERWLPDGRCYGHEYVALNPTRPDNKPGSFKINLKSGQWCDFATGHRGGDVISLAAYLFGMSQKEALYKVAEMLGVGHE